MTANKRCVEVIVSNRLKTKKRIVKRQRRGKKIIIDWQGKKRRKILEEIRILLRGGFSHLTNSGIFNYAITIVAFWLRKINYHTAPKITRNFVLIEVMTSLRGAYLW